MSDELDRFITAQKIDRIKNPTNHNREYFVDGSLIGVSSGPVHCFPNKIDGDRVHIVIADTHKTGESFVIPKEKLLSTDAEGMNNIAKGLF